jgi:hypothetical protein
MQKPAPSRSLEIIDVDAFDSEPDVVFLCKKKAKRERPQTKSAPPPIIEISSDDGDEELDTPREESSSASPSKVSPRPEFQISNTPPTPRSFGPPTPASSSSSQGRIYFLSSMLLRDLTHFVEEAVSESISRGWFSTETMAWVSIVR